jgi:hypothetical protein
MKATLDNKLISSYIGGTFENYVSARMTCFRAKIKAIEVVDGISLRVSFFSNTVRRKKYIEQTRNHLAKFKKTNFNSDDTIGLFQEVYIVNLLVFGDPDINEKGMILLRSGVVYQTITIYPPYLRTGREVVAY